ncbi:MAG: molybdopterin-dependent oxidoreductase [Deltaproteobacteria bacterium]|nr:molybdopterin-dependent oxidoreductase [Deltaproteobacteria bacterium]
MLADTICLRCHQKCHLTVEVVDGKIATVGDASPINRMAPCSEVCPIGMDIPAYVTAASTGKFKEAMEIQRKTNPFPSVCGRICHHPCEIECMRSVYDEPIAIQAVKRLVTDHAAKTEQVPAPVSITKKEKIAIIGSGPAGLTAAHDLVKEGYSVTVYESAPVAGGMLATVIPEFKLPYAALLADLDYIAALGISIKTNTPVGENPTLESILKDYNAVLIATGCWQPLALSLPGSDLNGIYSALPLLQEVKAGKDFRLTGKVVVIGGGNTAIDVARTALRLGASEVHLTCLESRGDMPAYQWEIENAVSEGVQIHPSLAPQRFKSNGIRKVTGVDFKRVDSTHAEADGKITWTLQDGPDSAPKITPIGTLRVDPETMATTIPGLFAAGDVVVGAGTVVEGIAAGRKAASSIIKLLGGSEKKIEPSIEEGFQRAREKVFAEFPAQLSRHKMPKLSPAEAVRSFQEVELGYTQQTGIEEAGRCLNCFTVCIKGATIPDVMYHPDRLLYPLKRTGQRGEGKWERISWDEAIGTIAGKLKEIKEKHGPEAIHVSCGSGQKHIGIQATKIAERLWPTPNTHLGRYTCIHPDVMANSVTFGDTITYEFGPDYAHAKCIVFWGSEPDVATPAQARVIHRALRQGIKLMVIDPRPIPMARRADLWLRIRPGTDMALALAMQHVIINENLYDKEFVEKYCSGFEKLREHVQQYTPQWAAEITGLQKEDIVKAARMYATIKPGCIYIRLGSGAQQVNSTQTCRSIGILIGLTGNVDVQGGNLLYYRTFRESLFWQTYLMFWGVKPPAALNEKRIGATEYPLMHKRALCNIPGTIQAMEEGKVQALWCVADNLIVAEADSKRIWDIMKNKLDLVFVSDFFMTPTAELADIVLPAAFYPECDLLVAAFGHPSSYITAARRVVEPLGECKDDREVAIEIAKKMGMDVTPWNSVKDYLNWRLKYQGITYDELSEKPGSMITFPRNYRRYETSTPPFSTASGKVELYSVVFEAMGVDALPVYKEPPEGPVSTPELFKEFPLIYTHYRLPCYMHSEGRQIKRQRQLIPEAYLELNPETAAKFGINQGDWVYLETPKSAGKWHVTYRARLVPDMHPDVVAGSHAWWFPEKASPEHGCFDSNINAVITLDPPFDPVVGIPQMRAILCRVKKA